MTNSDFSDSFDVLLNSYNIQAGFGEGSNKQGGIALDEYEKSTFLTQAQDQIVKTFFERTANSTGQGFDDSTRRQVDFSSLIKVHRFSNSTEGVLQSDNSCYDERGLKVRLSPDELGTEDHPSSILFMLNEKLEVGTGADKRTYVVVPINYREYDREMSKPYAQPLKKQAWRLFSNSGTGYDIDSEIIPIYGSTEKYETNTHYAIYLNGNWSDITEKPLLGHYLGTLSSDAEIPTSGIFASSSYYQIDETSKTIKDLSYVIRYVERPTPIILRRLPNGLTIDGYDGSKDIDGKESTTGMRCSLNPILHADILNRAFELAVTTRGGGTAQRQQQDNDRQ